MRILITGSNGYIGKRLIPVLLKEGHHLICCVRNKHRLSVFSDRQDVELLEIDFSLPIPAAIIPPEIDAAYYLIHSLSSNIGSFEEQEKKCARHFIQFVEKTKCKQIIYLSGIANSDQLSEHLQSRRKVGEILREGKIPLTELRAGIIVGSGSASFEIIRDLVEKLPIMITPQWIKTPCQPIAIRDVIYYLSGVLLKEDCYHQIFDIGGPEILTYKQMMLQFAEVRGMRRYIISLPVMTPRLSSYWLYFITSTNYRLAVNLVNSMKIPVVCSDNRISEILQHHPLSYKEAVSLAFSKIEQNMVESSWIDSFVSSEFNMEFSQLINVPEHGCLKDTRTLIFPKEDQERVLDRIWSIGGSKGWYYVNWLWKIRGFIDKIAGGVGLRRGRRHPSSLTTGDALDFWRVILADREAKRLLLYAEMRLPGEAWLEFTIKDNTESTCELTQTATFRPRGLTGRLYWYGIYPVHIMVFKGMARRIIR
ncbi:MAG: SDR family oxidoreductase [Bacteroidota bacterium]|nr:SDR family oxidoreductase [Bacteroidota bacterium]